MKLKHLDAFETFVDLDEKSKIVASRLMTLHSEKKGTELFSVGDQGSTEFFLVSGEVELTAVDGVKKTISHTDPAAHFPLALLRPRKFSGKVVSETVSLIKIDVSVLTELRNNVATAGDSLMAFSEFRNNDDGNVFSIDTDPDGIKKFLIGARNAIQENRLEISNFDDVSSTIFNVIRDPHVSIDTVVSAVQLDASISAKIIKAANSAFYGGMVKVDSVRTAVVRLGLDLCKQLISVMVLKEVFNSNKESLQEAMHKLWLSSLKLATYAVVVGKHARVNIQQGQILLAGLMADIGALAIIAYLDQFPGSMKQISEHVLSSSTLKKKIGTDLLKHWQFPESILNVIENGDDFSREAEEPDLCDIICVAKLIIRMTSYRKLPFDDISETACFQRLDFDTDNVSLINDIQEEAHRYMRLFSGASDL